MRRSRTEARATRCPARSGRCWDGSACGSGWLRWSGGWGRPRWCWRSGRAGDGGRLRPRPAAAGAVGDLGRLADRRRIGPDRDDAPAAAEAVRHFRSGRRGRAGASRAGREPHRGRRPAGCGYPARLARADRRSWPTGPPDRAGRSDRPGPSHGPGRVDGSAFGLLAIGVVAAPALLRPDPFGTLARRFLMPWADIDRVSRILLSVAPGDKVIAAGSDLTITAEARPLLAVGLGPAPEAAWLEWSDEAGSVVQRIAMEPARSAGSTEGSDARVHRFALTMPRLSHSIAYRVTSGDAASRRYRVTAMEPPSIASITARVEPPAYTRRPNSIARDPARIEAFEGSRVTLDITPDRPVRAIEVGWPAEAGKTTRRCPGRRRPEGSFSAIASESGPYRLSLDDEHGIRSRADESRMLIVRPDAPPTVTVRGDEGAKEANPHDTVTVALRGARRRRGRIGRAALRDPPRRVAVRRAGNGPSPGQGRPGWARRRAGAWPRCRSPRWD